MDKTNKMALVDRAKTNIKKWGLQNFETLGLCVCEEAGELAQAILQHRHQNGDRERIRQEAIDLGALCLQVLILMDNTKQESEAKHGN
jgi:NTP pyrophosphatase (non-canonical NTP hydrolase)